LSDDRPDPDALLAQTVDEGPGRPPGSEERIFEKFERGRKERATPGVGLGLAICRAIVGARGGSIRGETRGPGGARFVFTLPRGEPPVVDVGDENEAP
jgi:two-component system sensor histidine kinase KdpD